MRSEAVLAREGNRNHRELMKQLDDRLPLNVANARSAFERFLYIFEVSVGRTPTESEVKAVEVDWIVFCGDGDDSVPDYFQAYLES